MFWSKIAFFTSNSGYYYSAGGRILLFV